MRKTMFGLLSVCLLATTFAAAQATRTWVSRNGNDANPCSRTAPCRTFAGALAKTVAGGEIDALDAGEFGPVTINKAITIDGGGRHVASVLATVSDAITVSVGRKDVVILRNLRVQGVSGLYGSGSLDISAYGGTVLVENCDIVAGTTGIYGVGTALVVRHTTVTNARCGIQLDGSSVGAIDETNLYANDTGLCASSMITATRTTAAYNSTGFNNHGQLYLVDSRASANSVGIFNYGSRNLIVSKMTVTDNEQYGIYHWPEYSFESWGNNYVAGNAASLPPAQTIPPQ